MFKPAEEYREDYDQLALRFERNGWVANRGKKELHLYKYFSNQLPSRGELALEIGSGLGTFTSMLAERFDNVIALDLSPEMVRLARKNTSKLTNIEFITADVNKWDFPEEKFDCVASITTLCNMPLEPILKEMKGALKSGGILLVGDFYEIRGIRENMKNILREIKKWVRKLLGSNQQTRHASNWHWNYDPNRRYLTLKEVCSICNSLSLEAKVFERSRYYLIEWIKP